MQSYLEDAHIEKIAGAYNAYESIEGFARVVTIADTEQFGYSLSIPLYVRQTVDRSSMADRSFAECLELWNESRNGMRAAYSELKRMRTELAGDSNGKG